MGDHGTGGDGPDDDRIADLHDRPCGDDIDGPGHDDIVDGTASVGHGELDHDHPSRRDDVDLDHRGGDHHHHHPAGRR